MLILENSRKKFKKLVYEWSFDIDPDLKRLWDLIEKQTEIYDVKYEKHRICHDDKREVMWQKSWFPACTNVFCFS